MKKNKKFVEAVQKMQEHKGKTAFVVFRENGFLRTSVHGKMLEVADGLMIERMVGAYALISYENVIFILDNQGYKIFDGEDLGLKPKTE